MSLSESQLETLCAAMGWQGGTFWQVVDEIRARAAYAEHSLALLREVVKEWNEDNAGALSIQLFDRIEAFLTGREAVLSQDRSEDVPEVIRNMLEAKPLEPAFAKVLNENLLELASDERHGQGNVLEVLHQLYLECAIVLQNQRRAVHGPGSMQQARDILAAAGWQTFHDPNNSQEKA